MTSPPPPPTSAELVERWTKASGIAVEVAGRPDDLYLQSRLAAADNFEPAVSVAQITLPEDGVALDLGACLGIVSVSLSTLAPAGSVIAVEASPHLVAGLERTISLAPHQNIRLVTAAAGARAGTAEYHADPTGGAWGYVAEGAGDVIDETTVDDIVARFGLDRVDFIKIDIEGRELSALLGAEQTIAAHHPVLVVELNPFCLWRYGRTLPQDLTSWLAGHYPYLWAVDEHGNVIALTSDAEIDQILARVGTGGGLVDLVAASSPIAFDSPIWRVDATNGLDNVDTKTPPAPSRSLRDRLARLAGRH